MSRKTFYRPGAGHQEPYLYKACGLDNIYLLNGYHLEIHDGERYVHVEHELELHKAIGFHLVSQRKALSAKEIKFLRNVMELTQSKLAKLIGTTTQSVARWEKGAFEIPGPAEKTLRFLFLIRNLPRDELETFIQALDRVLGEIEELDDAEGSAAPAAEFYLNDRWEERERMCA